jgi:modulator of FtsH protease
VQAEAAATLTGLVFVAASINLERIMAFPGLPGRAAESILQLLQVFFVATVALVPNQPPQLLAAELLIIAGVAWTTQTILQLNYVKVRTGHPHSWLAYRVGLGQLATIPFCVAAVMLLLGSPHAMYWLVPGFVFSFVASMVSAWVLLVEIRR